LPVQHLPGLFTQSLSLEAVSIQACDITDQTTRPTLNSVTQSASRSRKRFQHFENRANSLADKFGEKNQDVRFFLAKLMYCLDPDNSPPDPKQWLKASLAQKPLQTSKLVTGPRIDWFAQEMRDICGDNFSVELLDKCIFRYAQFEHRSMEDVEEDAYVMWP
jgi:hypothetical protein